MPSNPPIRNNRLNSRQAPFFTPAQNLKWQMPAQAVAYAAPYVGTALLVGPVIAVLGGIYAKHYGLALTTIATVMLVARLFDAVTDPIIGYYSDRRRLRTGSRKPLIVVGGMLLVPCSYFLFVPPADVGAWYFAFWYMAFYLALTLFIIPYTAWANEFTIESREKTLVFSFLAVAGQGGGALFYLLPLLPFFVSTEITPEILQVTVLFGSVLLLLGLYVALKLVPNGPPPVANRASQEATMQSLSIKQQVTTLVVAFTQNRPFLIYVGAFMCLGVGVGMWAGVFFIYVDVYLKLGEHFARISLWGLFFGVLAVPVWYRFSLYWGKRRAWLVGMVLLAGVFLYTSLLRPGYSGFNALFALNMMMTFASASMGVIAAPMLCDVIDYGRLKDKVERTAQYFSIHALMTKVQVAIGGAIGIGIAGWFGFDVLAQNHSELSLIGLRIGVSWGPALFTFLAMVFITSMPLDERRMIIIRRRLAARARRAAGHTERSGRPVSDSV